MTLRDLQDLFDYWRENPPVHELVAAALEVPGSGPKQGSTGAVPSMADLQAQVALVNGG